MKYYYVSYSGSTYVEAENEDEACQLAMDKMTCDEINAYEVSENGTIYRNKGGVKVAL